MAQFTRLPTQSISATNPSVGANNSPAPGSSAQIAGQSPGGDLKPLQVDASDNLKISADALPLPAGAATEATLSTLNTKVPSNLTVTSTRLLVDGSGVTQPVSGPLTDAQLRATPVPVSGTVTANLGTIADVATQTTLAALNAKMPSLGQATMSASQPVTIASDQSPVQVAQPDLYITGQGTQTVVGNNILLSTAGTSSLDVSGYRSASVQVVSTGTAGTFIFENSNDNVNFQTMTVYNSAVVTGTPIIAAITATASQIIYTFPIRSRYIRVRIATTITGGSLQAFSRISQESWSPAVMQVGNATAANLNATVTATNLSTNVAQMGGVAVLMGAGATGTGSHRMTIANIATATLDNVASSATNVTLLASAAARMGASFQNESTATLYLKYGATASLTSYTVAIPPGGYFELPVPCYSGIIDGIWSAANGNCRVTSW